jgi:putative membrane protein insertion efficiency factor
MVATRQKALYFYFLMFLFFLQLPAYLHRWFFSPLLHTLCGPGCGCRFAPSCSQYWIESLKKHGPLQGLRFSLARLARCHPWNAGGYDPVPEISSLS